MKTRLNSSNLRTAFTLVELLVVMFILAVLIVIIVSVAGYVTRAANEKETSAIQAVVMDAVQAWRDNDTNDPKEYPRDQYVTANPGATSGRILINFLTGKIDWNGNGNLTDTNDVDNSASPSAKVAMDILLKLPKEAWNGNWNAPVNDSWGRPMRYDQTGGLGGRPVVISDGPDGQSGTDDDIRSDEHQ